MCQEIVATLEKWPLLRVATKRGTTVIIAECVRIYSGPYDLRPLYLAVPSILRPAEATALRYF